MNALHADVARAELPVRLGEAEGMRRGRHLVVARRMHRRAERAALRARLVLARSI